MTDRTIPSRVSLDEVDFKRGGGLVPVVAQDAGTGEVLMLGWADREALDATLSTGALHFHSRSRGRLWRKGETSGNTLAVASLHADCDGDSLLARVAPAGPTCHTGETSCFGDGAAPSGPAAPRAGTAAASGAARDDDATALLRLDATIAARAAERPEGSYTVRLLDDANLRLKKLGEESAELVAALATGDRSRAVEEAADLLYHVLVALRAEGVGSGALLGALERRAG